MATGVHCPDSSLICSPFGTCQYDTVDAQFFCSCRPGFHGDGTSCTGDCRDMAPVSVCYTRCIIPQALAGICLAFICSLSRCISLVQAPVGKCLSPSSFSYVIPYLFVELCSISIVCGVLFGYSFTRYLLILPGTITITIVTPSISYLC